jgi:hypothetical protein
MTEELVVATQTAVAMPSDVDETGLSDIARLKPTGLVLVQNTTRDTKGARPGQILDLLTGQAYDSITVVPLRVQRSRVMFPPGADLDAEPICRSNDGINPSPFAKVPQATRCEGCSKAKWFNREKPPCQEKRRMLVIVKESGLPRSITIGGKSIGPFQQLMDYIGQDVYMSRRAGHNYHLYDYFFTISGRREVSKKGNYFVMDFGDLKKVPAPGEYADLFNQFIVQAKRYAEEEDVAAAEQAVDNAVGEVVNAEFVSEGTTEV